MPQRIRYHRTVSSLVRPGNPEDDVESLRVRMRERETALQQRAAEVTRAKSDLAAFRIRYKQEVGLLHDELDELDRAIAEAELGEINKRLATEREDAAASSGRARVESAPRFTSDAVRRLFRDVAKTIHPDLAQDAVTRDRRHALMVEANRAYALGDEERLRRILHAWENSPEAVPDSDPDAARVRLARRIAQIDAELDVCARELADLQEAPLWKLKAMVDDAAARGKDLVADMVRRLKRDVIAARNRLDAMRWNP
jgi:hypothetical protein